MIKLITVYSTLDDLVVLYLCMSIVILFAVNWFVKRIRRNTLSSIEADVYLDSISKLDLENYTLHFDTNSKEKPVSLIVKMTLIVFAIIISVLPLYEFIETLRPQEIITSWSCFP